VLELVGGAHGGETPRVADSSAAGASRFFHNSAPPSKQNRLRGNLPELYRATPDAGRQEFSHVVPVRGEARP
jgi:hypothetical protein